MMAPPAPEGLPSGSPLSSLQTLLTEALLLSHTAGGHTWRNGGHPRTSCFQSTEHQSRGDARKKAPRQQPELCPLILESSQVPTPSLGSWDASTGQRCRVQSLTLAAFLLGSHTCPCEKEAAFPPAGEPVKTLGALPRLSAFLSHRLTTPSSFEEQSCSMICKHGTSLDVLPCQWHLERNIFRPFSPFSFSSFSYCCVQQPVQQITQTQCIIFLQASAHSMM